MIGMGKTLTVALLVTAFVTPLTLATAQETPDELAPRAIADSTYAVRVTVNAIVEGIRRGQLDPRQVNDPQLSAAVRRLAAAGARRVRRPPLADLGPVWDLQIDLPNFQPDGRDVLRVRADIFLATAIDSARAPVTLTFQRRGGRWDLSSHQGLVPRLIVLATALEASGRP